MALVELGRYPNGVIAAIAKSRLEWDGIGAVVFDENFAASEAFGKFDPVRLMVLDEDLEAARAALADAVED